MGIPNTINVDRRLPDHVETAEQLLTTEPAWAPGEFDDLRRLLYPVFRVEFSYGDGGHGSLLLDGLRANNDEHLVPYRSGTESVEPLDPVAAYDLQTGTGGRTLLVGHQCTNEQAAAVLPKQLTYAQNNRSIDGAALVRETFGLPESVTTDSFEEVTAVTKLYLPFWLARFEGEDGRLHQIAIRTAPDSDEPPTPVEWLSHFVLDEQSLLADSILTETGRRSTPNPEAEDTTVAEATAGGGADRSAGTTGATADGETTGVTADGKSTSTGSETGEPAAGADAGATAQSGTTGKSTAGPQQTADGHEVVQPDGIESLHADRVVDPTPDRGFEDVGGMSELKARLRSAVIDPVREAHRYQEYGLGTVNGVLLHGPPGCGKTHVAGSLAGELGWRFLPVTPAELTSKYVGEPAEKVADLFAIARANQPCMVFIDEIDAVASPRGEQDSQSQQQLVNQLLAELESVDDEDVLVVAATNLIEDVDSAIRRSGRFDERIEIPPPDADARREILRIHLAERPVDPDISLQEAVIETAGFAASDIELLVDDAARIAMQDHAEITEADLLAAADRLDTSIEEWIGKYDELVDESSGRGAIVQPEGTDHLQATRLVDRNVPLTFEDVGGMADLKRRFQEVVIDPIEHADAYEEYGLGTADGVLLHGPPGCGKTYVSRALAGEIDQYYIEVSPAELTSKYVGEPAERVAELFDIARANQPCVLLLDEIDAVAGNRDTAGTQSQQQLTNQLLTELEAVDDDEVVVIGTTNLLDAVDSAIRRSGRFDERIEIPPPDADARREILRIHLEERPSAAEIDWTAVTARTEGFAASDLGLVADEAARLALREGQVVTTETLLQAVDDIDSSISEWL